MPITERTLRKWRKEAFLMIKEIDETNGRQISASLVFEFTNRILRMTQELLDQHLIRKG